MIIDNTNTLNSPIRKVTARVERRRGAHLVATYTPSDALKSFKVERVGEENKFFGFGICQKLKLELIDNNREIQFEPGDSLAIFLSAGGEEITPFPTFYPEEIKRDENTNGLTITAYDLIHTATAHTFAELPLVAPYTIADVLQACHEILNFDEYDYPTWRNAFNLSYPTGANFGGTETLRYVLNAIAEATQTIYYIDGNQVLRFKAMILDEEGVITVGKSDYFTLKGEPQIELTSIVSATELGDNVRAGYEDIGVTQYVRDNPFWDLREDIDVIVEDALNNVYGMIMTPFDCSWRGNFLVEIGDRIDFVTKDDNILWCYFLNDTLEYEGGLSQTTSWKGGASAETASNPSTLGDALRQTYAKVDKANKQIDLVASDVKANGEEISSLGLTTDSITASVSKIDNNVSKLATEVSAKMTAEDVSISIQEALDEGVERVTTTTGFTFNEEGLHISRTDSEITTSITEDGMTIYRNNGAVLTADNLGVKAEDLHASTFLIIGTNSRFENYNNSRTGCFWIGG